MNIIIKIVCFILIFQTISISFILLKNKKHKVINTKIKTNYFDRIISNIDFKNNKYFKWVNSKTIFFTVLVLFVLLLFSMREIIGNYFLTIIFILPLSFLPIFIILIYSELSKIKMENNIINYILQLKNQSKISDDIIQIFRNVLPYTQNPLKNYVKAFLYEIDRGMHVSIAFKNFREKIRFKRFNQLLINLESCYFNGGNIYNLLDKTQKVFIKYQRERINKNEQTISARIVLFFLMFLIIFVYFVFIKNNLEIYNIMIKDFFGFIILFSNMISIWFMIGLIIYVQKIDD